ncbi:hypothetical protein KKD80_03160 [Patescibacteria group bacterium]|nr:hypothetical protein [Patescibacteria group bacterium]
MTDVDFIWEELMQRFDFEPPENREAFFEEVEGVVNEFIEYGKISPEEDIKAIMEALEVRRDDYLKEKTR